MMKQKLFAWGDDFTIKNETDEDVFFVDGKAFSIGDKLSFQDMQRHELVFIYRVYERGSTGFTSIAALRKSVEARATAFCERQGKGMIVLGERISEPPYILGHFPRIEIAFACIERPKAQ